ncbi:MAG TPA: aminoacyl-tRNA hydrolase, partial [Candidatus Woesebacteria bacterium]|nr:aminoacyl-tRNA hydrolase [Candidatus Woesebacteria bacterium]
IRYSLSPNEVYVAHDDLDIKLGEWKISLGKGPKLHNGITSIETVWKTKEFWRIRIGIENRTEPIAGESYVLQNFYHDEINILQESFKTISTDILK